MIHFDFDERYTDELVVGSAISRREGLVLSVTVHAAVVVLILFAPTVALFRPDPEELERERQELIQRERERQRFVFMQPRVDRETLKPPPRAELSDMNRQAQSRQRAENPQNPLPFSSGNTTERVESPEAERAKVDSESSPQPEANEDTARRLPPEDNGLRRPPPETPRAANSALGSALRNLQRYVQNETFNNPQGGVNDPGATIQFDSKGVEFGPWLRRFVAQVKRNWYVPEAAMTFRGRVVLQFNIHRSGRITDLVVAQPSDIGAFNRAAYNAILGSNPTEPLPPEYPEEQAFFTVIFYYNEQPGN